MRKKIFGLPLAATCAAACMCGLAGCAPAITQEPQSEQIAANAETDETTTLEAFVNENPDAMQRVRDAETSGSILGQLSTHIDVVENQIVYTCTYADEVFDVGADGITDAVISQVAEQLDESMGLVKDSFQKLKVYLATQAGISEDDTSIKVVYKLSDGRMIKTFLF